MYRIKPLALVALAILICGILSSAEAQKRLSPPIEPPVGALSGTYTSVVNAGQLSTGEVDLTSGTTYGWTSSGTTDGDLIGYLFISMNYATPQVPVDVEIGPVVTSASKVTGGSWSQLIFVKGEYAGSVQGCITGGEVVWNEKDATVTMNLELMSIKGTGAFAGSQGSGTFEGTLDQSTKASMVFGKLTLTY